MSFGDLLAGHFFRDNALNFLGALDALRSDPAEIIRRHRFEIAAHFYPNAVISHRSALESTLSTAGNSTSVCHKKSPRCASCLDWKFVSG